MNEVVPPLAQWLQANEPTVRLVAFLGLFAGLALLEVWRPRRLTVTRGYRWFPNLGLVVLDALFLRLLFPMLAVGVALAMRDAGAGLFNAAPVPYWLAFIVSVLLLDLVVYAQHVLMHKVPLLWRLHRVHHSDLEFDVSTALRFHPVEVGVSMLLKMLVVAIIGAPVAAVIVFEVLLNGTAMFNHANWRLPAAVDRWLRLLVVTPDMHRVHHSWYPRETDSNYGFNLPWWDRLFGTYTPQPRDGHSGMTIGLRQFREPSDQALRLLLIQPVRPIRNNKGS